jgi:hypothetical protein
MTHDDQELVRQAIVFAPSSAAKAPAARRDDQLSDRRRMHESHTPRVRRRLCRSIVPLPRRTAGHPATRRGHRERRGLGPAQPAAQDNGWRFAHGDALARFRRWLRQSAC